MSNLQGADADSLDELYLTALGRFPTAEERSRSLAHIGGVRGDDPDSPLSDVLWALVNSSEFALVH